MRFFRKLIRQLGRTKKADSPSFDLEARLHAAGAIVRHRSPFSDLKVPASERPLSDEVCRKWVIPFYLKNLVYERADFIAALRAVRGEVSPEIATMLLADFNWRPRITAAYFAAVWNWSELVSPIGRLLLRSDVCYAASGYCLALRRFNSRQSVDFLVEYLEYYLTRPELWFDQSDAMSALGHLDRENGTHERDRLLPLWQEFANKTKRSLVQSDQWFEKQYLTILDAARAVGA
jgi:hypothetical protein